MPIAVATRLLVVAAILLAIVVLALVGASLREAPLGRNGLIVHTLQEPNAGPFLIHLAGADGASVPARAHGDCPTFTPDGRHLVWSSDLDPKEFFIAAADGANARQLPHVEGRQTAISPDGQQIAWFRTIEERELPPEGLPIVPVVELWASVLTGGSGRLLATGAPDTVAADISPAWSPDGRYIAYATVREITTQEGTSGPRTSVRVVAVDGSGERVVTQRPGFWAGSLSWSPDARYLAYDGASSDVSPTVVGGSMATAPSNIFVADLEANEEIALTATGTHAVHPRWSPDGRSLAYLDAGQLVVVPVHDGRPIGPASVEPTGRAFRSISWSPDGEQLLALTHEPLPPDGSNASRELMLLSRDFSAGPQVVASGIITCHPSWQRLDP
jgi:TolB protein